MSSDRRWLRVIVPLLSMFALLLPATAQEKAQKGKIGITNPEAGAKPGEPKLEVEVVEITRFGAIPEVIKRPPGKFILAIVNKNDDPNAVFLLEHTQKNAQAGKGNPVLRLKGLSQIQAQGGKTATVVNVPSGEIRLNRADTGKTIFTINIE